MLKKVESIELVRRSKSIFLFFVLVTIQDVNNRKPFVSVTRIDQQVVNRATMPQSLRLLYEQAEPAPALHLLNPHRYDRLCLVI